MNFEEYQVAVMRTAAHHKSFDEQLAVLGLGVAGEAGEVADEIKKVVGHHHPLDKEKLCKEIGDLMWYCAALADHLGLRLDDVALANIEKLKKRYPNGFSVEASIARTDDVSRAPAGNAIGEARQVCLDCDAPLEGQVWQDAAGFLRCGACKDKPIAGFGREQYDERRKRSQARRCKCEKVEGRIIRELSCPVVHDPAGQEELL